MPLHDWNLTPAQAIAVQKDLSIRVRIEPLADEVRTVAGVDCAFGAFGRTVLAVAVLCDARTWEVLAHTSVCEECNFPYVPGLLSFREAPAVIEAINQLSCRPDLVMCDGQGLAHPRGLGLASHLGLWLDLPTIGAAKSRLCGEHRPVGARKGSRVRLTLEKRTVGCVLRTRDNVKPIYVSVGHRITLDEAAEWTLRACRGFRLPEPTRQAHQYVTRLKKTFLP